MNRSKTSFLFLCVWLSVFCISCGSSSPKVVDFETAKKKGIIYFRANKLSQARQQFDWAYSTPKGKRDELVLYHRGVIAYTELHLERAFEMLENTLQFSQEGSVFKEKAQTLLTKLETHFGVVILESGKGNLQNKGRLFLSRSKNQPFLNEEKKKQFEKIRVRLSNIEVQLPTKIYLPYGKYTINYVAITVKKSQKPQKFEIPLIFSHKR